MAPFSSDQVLSLKEHQKCQHIHPFTCGDCGAILEPTTDGWICPVDGCEYTQNWCNSHMADSTADCMSEKARDAILKTTYNLCERNRPREAVDWIIDQLDDLLNNADFVLCNSILRAADPNRLDDASIVTMLGVTLGAKHKLISRPVFFQRALNAVTDRRSLEDSEKLLSKYK